VHNKFVELHWDSGHDMFGFLKGRLQTLKKYRIIVRKKSNVRGGSLKGHEIVLLMQRVHNPCDDFKI
jgi:hypothetical protein